MFVMVDASLISQAVDRLRQAVPEGSRIILFGSCATSSAGPESDIDLMVVEPRLADWLGETVRLRRAIGPIGVPVDVVVVDAAEFARWCDTPTTIHYEAAKKGREYARVA